VAKAEGAEEKVEGTGGRQGFTLILSLNPKFEARSTKQIRNSNFRMFKTVMPYKKVNSFWSFEFGELENCFGFRYSDFGFILRCIRSEQQN
jgi:hypothetical protein